MEDGTDKSVKWVDADNPRFAVYDVGTPYDPIDDIVLDKMTGLTWERSPDTTKKRNWASAVRVCYSKRYAYHWGWRLPTIEELATLVYDLEVQPGLPPGHPFILPGHLGKAYWSSTTDAIETYTAWFLDFYGGLHTEVKDDWETYVWCVRGGHGHDGQ